MKGFLRKAIGADRPKVITVTTVSRHSAEQALLWLLSQQSTDEALRQYPLWCFCVEPCEPVAGYHRFFSGVDSRSVRFNLRDRWVSLSVVAWTGEKGCNWLKLRSLFRPPFRVYIINEADDLFSSPWWMSIHARRRLRDAVVNHSLTAADFCAGATNWVLRATKRRAAYVAQATRRAWIPVRDQLRGIVIFLAQLHSAPYRWVFQSLQGTEAIPFSLPKLTSDAYQEISVAGRKWNAPQVRLALDRALDRSEGVIVFRQEGETASPDALIALIRHKDVFAAALQVQQTDWRKKLISKFPFRQLQPGEVTQTVAPYSTLLAMRVEAVRFFGVPEVASSGSAYMLLCWQAAAAGLACLTLGTNLPASQEVDVPFEHAEFVKALLFSRRLRSLAVRQPDLVRGNIATMPVYGLPFRGKPRVLVVSPYLPFPMSHGGAVRIYNLCLALSSQVDFVLVCFRESNDAVHYEELSRAFREVHVVDNDEKKDRRPGNCSLPKQVFEYRNSAMRALIRQVCEDRKIDLLQLEYTQMAEYADCSEGRPVLLVEHDVTFTLFRQISETTRTKAARQEYLRWFDFETKALRAAGWVWAMSQHDRDLVLQRGAEPDRVATVPNGVDLLRFRPEEEAKHDHTRVFFIGSFRHLPNLLAFEALRNRIMPAVRRVMANATLHVIAGPEYQRHADLAGRADLLFPQDGIVVEGFVEDVRPAYREADVVVIPLPVSAGTNIKLMEAMACGRAVVSTPIGCVGLDLRDGEDLLIRELEGGFAEAVVELLTNARKRDRIAAQARKTAEERFGWDGIAAGALETYSALMERASYQSPMSFHHQTPTPIQSTR